MSAAMLIEAWGDTMLTTALLVLAVLLIRKPFARHFGARLTYSLWLIPALRLILPPLPFADPVMPQVAATSAETTVIHWTVGPQTVDAGSSALSYSWGPFDLMSLAFGAWVAGMIAVLVAALMADRRFRQAVLEEAVELEPIGSIRLVMTDAVDGPVAFGLWRRFVAVPHDFFARYVAEERVLAIDHELAHHRHGDLWANAAALVLLASQWFNPFAWRAIRAFRFDQEAACDARVLNMVDREGADREGRSDRAASYATAIVKAAVGPRLSLAAPMAVHDNLQERLTMLMRQDISKKRGLAGRLLVGGATLAVLGATATLVPATMASAGSQQDELPEPPAPPPPVDAPPPPDAPAAPDATQVMVFTDSDEDVSESSATAKDGKKREVHRIVIRRDGAGDGKAPVALSGSAHGKDKTRIIEFRAPGELSRDDVLATLREQGITGKRAEAIADKLEAKRKERFRTALAPMPPMPPMAPVAWAPSHGHAMAVARCGTGKAASTVDQEEISGGKRSRYVMIACADGAEGQSARLSALKKAREAFAEGEHARRMSEAMRAKVAADLEKAIADTEKSGD